jgi:predicted aspartyl protease
VPTAFRFSTADLLQMLAAGSVPQDLAELISAEQGFRTPTIDLTATGFAAFDMPLVAGKYFIPTRATCVIVTRDAALTTGITFALAQNGSDISATVTISTANANARSAPVVLNPLLPAIVDAKVMTTFPLQWHITVGGAGAGLTSLTGYFLIDGSFRDL